GADGAGEDRFGVALAAHNVGARPHAAWDDPEFTVTRADRTLARYVNALAEVLLPLHVFVVAVDRFIGDLERGKVATQCLEDQLQHFAPVRERVVLRPPHPSTVSVEQFDAL